MFECYEIGNGIFYVGDCFEVMETLEAQSVDLILCDLPYGTTHNKWDTVIPFEPLWEVYWKLLRDNRAIVLTGAQPFTTKLINSQIGFFKYCWIWKKNTVSGFVQAKNMPLKNYEDICIFSKGVVNQKELSINRMVYNPQDLVLLDTPNVRASRKPSLSSFAYTGKDYEQTFTNYPRQILEFNSESNGFHPTQKPVELFEYMIRTYSNENEVILDNCAGSGTTAIACENTNRRWICIEKNPEYAEKAIERIKKHISEKSISLEGFFDDVQD